uniref:Reverse transcriptase domain-containing protein n=1 Tax=Bracon brevicornis TaxID=1563983 RepID=A0A6V7LWV4_9HYME
MHIDTQGHPPIRGGARRYVPQLLKAAHEKAAQLLKEDVIEPSQSDWCSWPVLVKKPDGSYRFCVDYRPLNAVTKHLALPMQNLEDLLDCAHGAMHVSKIDISQAFYHIPLDEKSKEKTALAVPGMAPGLFQFKRMPFGLKNSPAYFQMLTDKIVPPAWSTNVRKYVDDFLIFTRTLEEHEWFVTNLIRVLQENNLTINPDKCEFLCEKLSFLGYLLTPEGLTADPDRTKPITQYPVPKNVNVMCSNHHCETRK